MLVSVELGCGGVWNQIEERGNDLKRGGVAWHGMALVVALRDFMRYDTLSTLILEYCKYQLIDQLALRGKAIKELISVYRIMYFT